MRTTLLLIALVGSLLSGCKQESSIIRESWIEKPLSQWPGFALTNEISFGDTTYSDLANSFLVNTGYDTLGVSCKHIFMVFEIRQGLGTIDLGGNFRSWKLYPKNDKGNYVFTKRLINRDPEEAIGQFNTLKARDWIIFDLEEQNPDLYPLKIRHTPIRNNEYVYAVGWGMKQEDNSLPALIQLQCVENLGDYYYMRTLSTDIQPHGRSGSPVIDRNGYLVGMVSGAEGNFAVIGSVNYLRKVFQRYGVEYQKHGS